MINRPLKYATDVVEGRILTNKYIKILCKNFIDDYNNEDLEFVYDEKESEKICKLLKCINFATGSVAGQCMYDACVDYQYFLILNIFCWKHRDNMQKRRYETCILWIARKNSKTVNISLIFILLMLLSPQYSQFYSGSNTRDQAKIIFDDTKKIINSSPLIKKHFKILRDSIECKINNNIFKPLSSDYNTTDGLMPSGAILDEVGAFKDGGLIESMSSGMLSVKNRLLILISTSYPNQDNPFLEYIDYAKSVLEGKVEDKKIFPMLYSLDKDDELTPDNFLKANPLQASLPDGKEYLISEYKKAKEMGGKKLESFMCKHLNIWLDGNGEETYIDINRWKECEVDTIDWNDKDIIVGVDLSKTTDLCSVSMAYRGDDGIFYCNSMGFLPTEDNPNRREKIDYKIMERNGYCIRTEGYSIDYGIVEEYIRNIESKYNCRIQSIVTDPYNCQNMMASLANDYEVILLTQTYTHLSSAVKTLREDVLNKKVRYEKNALLDWCMGNTIVIEGKGGGELIGKEKCYKNCKRIDMVATLINCMTQLIIEDNCTYSFEEAMNSLDKWNNM